MRVGVVDIETTNFFKKGGVIVEVGLAVYDTELDRVCSLFGSVCSEDGLKASDREAWIFKNSDLTPSDVRKAPKFGVLVPLLNDHLRSLDAMTAYNKAFDFEFLRDRGVQLGVEFPCLMKLAMPICQIPNPRSSSGSFKWPSVEEAYAHLYPGTPYSEKHRGLSDAIDEAMILQAMIKLKGLEPLIAPQNGVADT